MSTGYTPFELNSFHTIRTPANFNEATNTSLEKVPKDATARQEQIQGIIAEVQQRLNEAADKLADKMNKRKLTSFQVGDWVWVTQDVCNTQPNTSRKLRHLYAGPYQIVACEGKNAYRMSGMPSDLPPVQNVQHLKPFYRTEQRFKTRPDDLPRPIFTPTGIEWLVEEIVDYQKRGKVYKYKVKWQGTPDLSWEPASALTNAWDLVQEYHAKNPKHPEPPAKKRRTSLRRSSLRP